MAFEIFAKAFQPFALKVRSMPSRTKRFVYAVFQIADTANQAVSIGLKLFTRPSTAFTR
ncbi:hypothetical protein DOQ08_02953 [Marinobacter litoralis]|uniref:Uncharacterized protein n=1 Tax=Marinobacter litoralis TaxID=187981 RepID=A0A3M2RA56_9GAMM|nr:hypothetical protein DOQ08_02953 [Marinobacter litoralis]